MSEGGETIRLLDAVDAGECAVCGTGVSGRRWICARCLREVPELLHGELREVARETAGPKQARRWAATCVAIVRALET